MSRFADIHRALQDHCLRLGKFAAVNGHEPKHATPKGLTAGAWFDHFAPVLASGLAATTVCTVWSIRIYTPLTGEVQAARDRSQDAIDPIMLDAADAVCASFTAHYTLGGLVKGVDVRGADSGEQLAGAAGYATIDGVLHRILTITVPLIVNDLWPETA